MSTQYGIVDHTGTHHDTGHTLQGAKVSATRQGLTAVSTRSPHGYTINIVARKVGGVWLDQ